MLCYETSFGFICKKKAQHEYRIIESPSVWDHEGHQVSKVSLKLSTSQLLLWLRECSIKCLTAWANPPGYTWKTMFQLLDFYIFIVLNILRTVNKEYRENNVSQQQSSLNFIWTVINSTTNACKMHSDSLFFILLWRLNRKLANS